MILQRYLFISRFISAFIVAGLITLTAFAQDGQMQEDSLQVATSDVTQGSSQKVSDEQVSPSDTLKPKKFISGVELVIDYGKILTLWTNFESKYEGGVNVRFYERIVLAAEVGHAELNPLKAYDNAVYYTVRGSYARLGLDYYTSYDPKSFYYAGLRYGMSMFEDEGLFLIDSEYWEDYQEGFGSKDLTASWAEFILGTETYLKIGKKDPDNPESKLLIGWKFRLRFLVDFENREEPRIYSIPGYGRTFDKTVPSLNFYMKYRIGS